MLGANGDGSKGINWDFNDLGHLAWDEFLVFHQLCGMNLGIDLLQAGELKGEKME